MSLGLILQGHCLCTNTACDRFRSRKLKKHNPTSSYIPHKSCNISHQLLAPTALFLWSRNIGQCFRGLIFLIPKFLNLRTVSRWMLKHYKLKSVSNHLTTVPTVPAQRIGVPPFDLCWRSLLHRLHTETFISKCLNVFVIARFEFPNFFLITDRIFSRSTMFIVNILSVSLSKLFVRSIYEIFIGIEVLLVKNHKNSLRSWQSLR